jgi:alpha-glucosidase
MKSIIFSGLLVLLTLAIQAQTAGKVFWSEDFSAGEFADGWQVVAMNDSAVNWFVTDQPYPGSYGRTYQAPPIASGSRGYHMQFGPGMKVQKNGRKWRDAEKWPEAYVQSSAIDCSTHKSVVLKFQQNFFWNRRDMKRGGAGLFVGVSNDGESWTEYDVRNGIGSGEDCPNPMDVELNITRTAAGESAVYIRFYWKGLCHWYWMVDDIQLSEAFDADIEVYALSSHEETGNVFSEKDKLIYKIVNLGARPITEGFNCYLNIDQRPSITSLVKASKTNPIGIIDTVSVVFDNIDLTDFGIHKLKFYSDLSGDQRSDNDSLSSVLYSGAFSLGDITAFNQTSDEFEFSCNNAKLKLIFLRPDIYRIWMAYDGEFSNPAGNDLVIHEPKNRPSVKWSDQGDYYLFTTNEIAVRAYKKPLRFAQYKADNKTLVWEESQGMTYGKKTIQYVKRADDEYYYGGGMQNGRFSHRDKTIKLTIDYDWEDGGNPNPAPFFMSSKGWGALRNTYAPGEYSYRDTIMLEHSEARFDCYFFSGNSLKDILGDYTDLTGKPFLPPRWALGYGDANCYNRGAKMDIKTVGSTGTGFGGTTPDVIQIIADEYIKHDMPRGWILPNDGYGCGYTKLDSVIVELKKRGFMTGLWTENGVEKIAHEVGTLGSRLCKLDVAWVGDGYKFAIDGVKAAYEGIENNSDARGFIWSVCGWAGTHRHSTVWTGDQSGSWDYIRWHIPTVIGSGLSAQNAATGDVDGIFGGSDSTYVRDLQWKCFTPIFMSMSGWASNNKNGIKDKQPWLFGEPFTSINRQYLKLKQRLTPYMYDLCAEANMTGVPSVRGLVLEYPNDPVTWGSDTKYEFLLGTDFLVAPVYKAEDYRDSIYFPEGKWIDYWDGTEYQGNTWLNHYHAPLDKLPLFVRSGAIIPMYQPMYYDWERAKDTLCLDIYPNGSSSYELYEDDGLTRKHREGEYSTTLFEVQEDSESLMLKINQVKGSYQDQPQDRVYLVDIHSEKAPRAVLIDGKKVKKSKGSNKKSKAAWSYYVKGNDQIVKITTHKIDINQESIVELQY